MRKIIIAVSGLMLFGCSNNQKVKTTSFQAWTDSINTKLIKDDELKMKMKMKNGILNDWVMITDFSSNKVVLALFDSSKYESTGVISFHNDNTINYWEYNPQPGCGNGIFYLKDSSSTWEYSPDTRNILLTLYGGYSMYGEFKKKIEYKMDSSGIDKMILIKSKTYCDTAWTWAETLKFGTKD